MRHLLRHVTVLLLTNIIGISAASAATYYVSGTGSDKASGLSPNSAWRTIGKVNQAKVVPGDSILFEGGSNFPGSLYFDQTRGGSAAQPITISSYGNGKATIQASGENKGI